MDETSTTKPDCWRCAHRRELPGDAHVLCMNLDATVTGHPSGVRNGWFIWPFNFDPTWLRSCDGFVEQPAKVDRELTGHNQ